ncbi:MAG: hypothetical protein F4Z55_05470, partial [Boseongicola sp. SB0667_bin_21]|nr:hypothetical protein [Boseongicola sp. SB0667_bin_21]
GLDPDPGHRVDTAAPAFASATVSGTALTVTFGEPLDEGAAPAGSAFTVTAVLADGAARSIAGTGTAGAAGAVVTVTLAEAVAHGETLAVAYAPPDENPLRDLAGNAAAVFSGEAATNETLAGASAVEAVALVSDPGASGTYAAEDEIKVQITFSEAVTVDTDGGTPRLKLDLGGEEGSGERWAVYESGIGEAALAFVYRARRPDTSTGGVEVLADTLEVNGGTIRSAATESDAALAHPGLDPDPGHRVDTTAPMLARVTTLDGTTLTLAFDEALDTNSVPPAEAFTVTKGDEAAATVTAVAFGNGDGTTLELTVTPAVVRPPPGSGGRGVTVVRYTPPTAKAAARLLDAAGNAARAFARSVTHTAPPRPTGATVGGTVLTVSFDLSLSTRRAHWPAADAWTVTVNGAGRAVAGRVLRGNRTDVALTLASAVAPGDAVTLGYGGTRLRDVEGRAVAAFSGLRVNNAPDLVGATFDGAALTLTFDTALDAGSTPATGAFAVKTDGEAADLAAEDAVALSGADGTLTLAAAVAPDAAVTVSYAPPAAGARLRDAAGNVASGFTDAPVAHADETEPAPGPTVTGVEVTSVPGLDGAHAEGGTGADGAPAEGETGADGAYAEGETVTAEVTFSEPVTVVTADGTPTLALIAETGAGDVRILRAPYASGSGTARIAFAWTVTEADGSLGAVRIAASGLRLDGGTIAGADGTPAELGFGAAPAVTAVEIADEPDGRWEAGDAVEATFRFAEPVTVSGAPSVRLVPDGAPGRQVAYAGGSGTDALTFRHTLGQDEGPWTRVVLVSNSLALDGGTILSAGGGLPAGLEFTQAQRALEPAALRPAVTGVAVASSPASGDTYGPGESIEVRVTFGAAVEVDTSGGTPRLKIKMDPRWGEFWAVYAGGTGTQSLTFVHTVAEPNTAPTGIAVLANTLAANGGTIRSAAGAGADLAHAGLGHDPKHKVDWRRAAAATAAAPTVTGVAVVSDAGSDDTYVLGDVIRIGVTFSEAVAVDTSGGAPRLTIDMDPAHWGAKQAGYEGGTGTSRLIFAHTVVRPNISTQGIAVLASTLEGNGGTIRSAATGVDANLAHAGLGHDPKHMVDWRPELSVADAEAREGTDPAVEFQVSLSRAATETVTVDYATADGTAVAGEDYTATSGTLTFAVGEIAKTVAVPVLDDSHDEGRESFAFRLSNATGARIADGEATGTIANADPVPKAWLARFGRSVAEQGVAAVRDRLAAGRAPGFRGRIAGQPLPDGAGTETGTADGGTQEDPFALPAFTEDERRAFLALLALETGEGGEDDGGLEDGATEEDGGTAPVDVLTGTSFDLVQDTDGGLSFGFWGRAARSGFDGREGDLAIDGEATTAMLGTDWKRRDTLFGLMLFRSRGEGGYAGPAGAGRIEADLSGLVPWAGRRMDGAPTLWGAVGTGRGEMALTPEGGDPVASGLRWSMAAAGADGVPATVAALGDAEIRWRADALATRTSSDALDGLAVTSAGTSRLRLGLEAAWTRALATGTTLSPRLEFGLRHDGGDSETGFGLEAGGGLRLEDPGHGLSVSLDGRALALHEDGNLKDWGLAVSLSWDPRPETLLGPSVVATRGWGGASSGGVAALLDPETLPGIDGGTGGGSGSLGLEM